MRVKAYISGLKELIILLITKGDPRCRKQGIWFLQRRRGFNVLNCKGS